MKSIWRTISIASAMLSIALLLFGAVNAGAWITDGVDIHRLRTVEGFALWCVALGLAFSVTVLARDRADRIPTPDERPSEYLKTLRLFAAGGLIVASLGFVNLGFWHWSVGGLSQKQMVMLAMIPIFIVGYHVMAYDNPADR